MKKTLLLFLVTIVSAITALASPTGKIMGESKDIPIQKLNQQTTNPFRPHAPERVLFNAYLDTQIQGHYTYNYHDEDDVCGSVDLYYYDNPERVLEFPMEGVTVTLSEHSFLL